MRLPKHKCALIITHNEHLNEYRSIEEWGGAWISEEEKARAIATGEAWSIQWYPETPIGFCRVDGASLEAVIAEALRLEDAGN